PAALLIAEMPIISRRVAGAELPNGSEPPQLRMRAPRLVLPAVEQGADHRGAENDRAVSHLPSPRRARPWRPLKQEATPRIGHPRSVLPKALGRRYGV